MANLSDTRKDGSAGSIQAAKTVEQGMEMSGAQAARVANSDNRPELTAFIGALAMQRPVSIDKAARLIEHFLTENTSFTAEVIAAQMRMDQWEDDLSNAEQLQDIAERAADFLNTEQGIDLYNSFKTVFAKTHGEMFP
jgi:hypothetical protein